MDHHHHHHQRPFFLLLFVARAAIIWIDDDDEGKKKGKKKKKEKKKYSFNQSEVLLCETVVSFLVQKKMSNDDEALKSPVNGIMLKYVKLKNGIKLRVASAGKSCIVLICSFRSSSFYVVETPFLQIV